MLPRPLHHVPAIGWKAHDPLVASEVLAKSG